MVTRVHGAWEWDETKNAANRQDHKLDFTALDGFDLSTASIREDRRADYGERRYQAMGPIDGRLCVVVFTTRGDRFRAMSLRYANRRERDDYAKDEVRHT